MATASDFAWIVGDNAMEVSARTASGGQGDENLRLEFTLDRPIPSQGGILMFMVRGLTKRGYSEPRIIMNDLRTVIGHVQSCVGADNDTWFTQLIRIDGGVLQEGLNWVRFFLATASSVTGGPDSYSLRAAACHYHKSV